MVVSDGANPAVLCDDVKPPGPSTCAGEENIEDDTLRRVHREKDFISLLSSTPGRLTSRVASVFKKTPKPFHVFVFM